MWPPLNPLIGMLGQVEYLWPPGSWVERDGPEQMMVQMSCVVRLLPVRVNKDGKALTVEASCLPPPLRPVYPPHLYRYLPDPVP